MRAVIGVTDNRWAVYLRERPQLSEANFWVPSGRSAFKALQPGEPFLFKTHWPENQLVGGGFFSGFARLTVREAWDLFGEGNGVGSLDELVRAIGRYRAGAGVSTGSTDSKPSSRRTPGSQESTRAGVSTSSTIGCVLLRDLFFVPDADALDAPTDFAKNIVNFKGYDLDGSGGHVDLMFETMLRRAEVRIGDVEGLPSLFPGPVFGRDKLVRSRVGQQAFKGLVLTSYDRRCAITGTHIAPTLEAAHIRPVAREGENRVDNGLLLRSDVHTLFDLGYLGVDPRYRLQVSPALREEWGNGREFYERAGAPIQVPQARVDRPSGDAIEWHLDTVFRH